MFEVSAAALWESANTVLQVKHYLRLKHII